MDIGAGQACTSDRPAVTSEERAARQRSYLASLTTWVDMDLLASDRLWR
jgi:hypothetical protein